MLCAVIHDLTLPGIDLLAVVLRFGGKLAYQHSDNYSTEGLGAIVLVVKEAFGNALL